MAGPQERRDVGVPPALLKNAESRVDENDRDVCGRGASDHVAGVLNVARRVRDDELSLIRAEVTIGNVDGDSLLALGRQAVGDERQIEIRPCHGRCLANGFELIGVNRPGVVEQPADERRLAVVDRPDGDEAKKLLVLVLAKVALDVRCDELFFRRHQK